MKDMLGEGVTSLIIDCESVAYDVEKDAILPFQVLSTRKKKDASTDDVKVQVCLFPFDLMYLNGKSYLDVGFGERRELLRKSVTETKGQLHFATSHVADDADEIGEPPLARTHAHPPAPPPGYALASSPPALNGVRPSETCRSWCHVVAVLRVTAAELLDLSIKENTEGLMVKTMDGTYEIAKRSHSWLKLKKDYLDGVGDTLDLVPIGGWHGKGKRAGNFGAYLLACYDPETEEYQYCGFDINLHPPFFTRSHSAVSRGVHHACLTRCADWRTFGAVVSTWGFRSICKIGTGFSDEALKAHSAFFAQHTIDTPKEYYQLCDSDNTLVPDAWFEPCQVWEVKVRQRHGG